MVCSVSLPTPKNVEVPPVAIAAAISIGLPVGLDDANRGKVDGDLTLLDGASSVLLRLEVGDGEATIPGEAALRVDGDPDSGNWTEFDLELLLDLFGGQVLWNILQFDTSGVGCLLNFLLLLGGKLGLDGLHVEDLLLGCADGIRITGIVFITLVLLQILKAGLDGRNLVTLDIVFFAGSLLPVAHLGTEIFFLSLDLIVGVPDVITMKHSDVRVSADSIFTNIDAERVENGILLLPLSETFAHLHFGLQDAAIEMLCNGSSVSELDLRHVLTHIDHLW